MVESTSEIVGYLTDNNCPFHGRGFKNLNSNDTLPGLLVEFGDEGTRIRTVDPLNSVIKGIEVVVSSAELEFAAIKKMHHVLLCLWRRNRKPQRVGLAP